MSREGRREGSGGRGSSWRLVGSILGIRRVGSTPLHCTLLNYITYTAVHMCCSNGVHSNVLYIVGNVEEGEELISLSHYIYI